MIRDVYPDPDFFYTPDRRSEPRVLGHFIGLHQIILQSFNLRTLYGTVLWKKTAYLYYTTINHSHEVIIR
jgi:hypothetical protein